MEHTVQNKKWTSDTSNTPNVIKKNRLICLYMNARSIMNKMTALEASILEYDPNVIGITESWTTENHLQSELQLEGYTCYRRDRMMYERSKGGGVLLYMKNIFLHGEKNDITVNNSTEALWCFFLLLLLVSSGCLTGSWSVWSHAVTPHSTIYHLVFVI